VRAGLAGLIGGSGARRIAVGAPAALAGLALLVAASLPAPAPPPPDKAAVARAARAAEASRLTGLWHSTPVERLFPAELRVDDDTPPTTFTRLGVAPEAGCPAVLAPALLRAVKVPCKRVLRATYVDATQAVVATAGIVVLDRPPEGEPRVAGNVPLMRAYRVKATDAARFGDEQRISSGSAVLVGEPDAPYLLTVVVGAADGRRPARLPKAFDSAGRREIDRAEWRLSGDGFLVGFKNSLYRTIQAGRPRAAP
jgi:hypothetical protein